MMADVALPLPTPAPSTSASAAPVAAASAHARRPPPPVIRGPPANWVPKPDMPKRLVDKLKYLHSIGQINLEDGSW